MVLDLDRISWLTKLVELCESDLIFASRHSPWRKGLLKMLKIEATRLEFQGSQRSIKRRAAPAGRC